MKTFKQCAIENVIDAQIVNYVFDLAELDEINRQRDKLISVIYDFSYPTYRDVEDCLYENFPLAYQIDHAGLGLRTNPVEMAAETLYNILNQ